MVTWAGALTKRGLASVRHLRARRLCRQKIDAIYSNNAALREHARNISRGDLRAVERYWEGLGLRVNTKWHVAYSWLDGQLDERRVPEDLFYTWAEPRLNRMDLAQAYCDKNLYDSLFPDVETPETVVRNISGGYFRSDYSSISAPEAVELVAARGDEDFVIKPSLYSGGGKGIRIVGPELQDPELVTQLFAEYGQDFVVQRRLVQHEATAVFHPTSVNTLRPLTLRVGGHIVLVSCVFRMGNHNSWVDNQSAGGIACQVNGAGVLKPYGIDKYLNKHESHPATLRPFGCALPSVAEATSMVIALHERLPHFDLVSWDVAIDHQGEPVLVELNVIDQEINFHQAGGVPLLGDHTDEIMQDLTQRKATMSLVVW
jgi:hypothetical protein